MGMGNSQKRGGARPGAGRPRRKIPARQTNLALSQETRELLALAGEGDMSRGAERLAATFAWQKLLRAAGHPDPGEIFDEDENEYAFRCPECGALATVWEPLNDYLKHTMVDNRQHWRCWRGHEGEVAP